MQQNSQEKIHEIKLIDLFCFVNRRILKLNNNSL